MIIQKRHCRTKQQTSETFRIEHSLDEYFVLREFLHRDDLPPLNSTTFRERFCQCENQRRTINATRKERTDRADHPLCLREFEVEVGRGKTVIEAIKKIGVTEQTFL